MSHYSSNNKYMKDYDKYKESSYLMSWHVTSLYGREMSQKLPVGGFKLVENISQSSKDFIENYNEDSDEGYFFEVEAQHPKILHDLYNDLSFLLKRMKIAKVGKLVANLKDERSYTHKKFKTMTKSWSDERSAEPLN